MSSSPLKRSAADDATEFQNRANNLLIALINRTLRYNEGLWKHAWKLNKLVADLEEASEGNTSTHQGIETYFAKYMYKHTIEQKLIPTLYPYYDRECPTYIFGVHDHADDDDPDYKEDDMYRYWPSTSTIPRYFAPFEIYLGSLTHAGILLCRHVRRHGPSARRL